MTTAADDSAVEDAFEAILAGRPVPEGAAGLAAFTGAVRASATRPGRPHAALAELLATGLLTDQSSPSVRTARSAGSAPERRPSRVRTRRRPAMIFTALIAKFLSAGAVAQAATGATVAVVAFTGVGAVGALPDPVQDTFATVVADLTPLEPPTSEEITAGTTEVVIPAETLAEDGGTADELLAGAEAAATAAFVKEWAIAGPGGPEGSESFSAWIHEGNEDARVKEWLRENGMNFGNVVSKWASGKDWSEAELKVLGEVVADKDAAPITTVTDETVTDAEETEETEVATTKDRGSRGNAKTEGDAKGKGNGKN